MSVSTSNMDIASIETTVKELTSVKSAKHPNAHNTTATKGTPENVFSSEHLADVSLEHTVHMLRFHENPPFEIKLKTGAVAFS